MTMLHRSFIVILGVVLNLLFLFLPSRRKLLDARAILFFLCGGGLRELFELLCRRLKEKGNAFERTGGGKRSLPKHKGFQGRDILSADKRLSGRLIPRGLTGSFPL